MYTTLLQHNQKHFNFPICAKPWQGEPLDGVPYHDGKGSLQLSASVRSTEEGQGLYRYTGGPPTSTALEIHVSVLLAADTISGIPPVMP